MTTKAEYLLARYAEEEGAARFCAAGFGARWHIVENGQTMIADETGSEVIHYDGARNLFDVDHIAYHDPAYVIADIAAKRRIVERLAEVISESAAHYEGPDYYGGITACELVIDALLSVYADRDDYPEEWR